MQQRHFLIPDAEAMKMNPAAQTKKSLVQIVAGSCLVFALASAGLAGNTVQNGFWLITPEEAALPGASPEELGVRGGVPLDIGREVEDIGPMIEVVRPEENKPHSPPIEVSVRFAPRQQPIDFKSLKVTVVKFIAIDITDRVRPYLSETGIQIPDAKLPGGEHTVRVTLSDVTGAVSIKQATFKIQ